MARKGAVKAASKIKKTRKKQAGKKPAAKKVVKEQQPPIQTEQIQEVQEQTSTIQQVAAEVSAEIPKTEAVADVANLSNEAVTTGITSTTPQKSEENINKESSEPINAQPVQETKMEDTTMGREDKESDNKGIGKEYKSSDFSQPPSEAIGSSKIFLYVGISIAVVALIIGGLFFIKGFGKIGGEELTGSTVVAYCSDSDGGYNRFTKGVAEGTYYLDYKAGQYMDECATTEENKLTEYYCKNDLVVYATEPCPDGMSCQDGICT